MAQAKLKSAATVTAQPVQPKKTLADYKTLAETAVKNLEAAYGELGKILIDAGIDLGKQEYGVLVLHLKHKGISPAQIECARGVALKKIDPSIVFYAEKKLRLPKLPMSAQQKLRKVSHPIKKPDGEVVHKKMGPNDHFGTLPTGRPRLYQNPPSGGANHQSPVRHQRVKVRAL